MRRKRPVGSHIAGHPAAGYLHRGVMEPSHVLHFDGSCVGNGRDDAYGSWAFRIAKAGGVELAFGSGPATGVVTVNVAEWQGLIGGLQALADYGVRGLMIHGDSMLVINQIMGQWQARDRLRELRTEALTLLGDIKARWRAAWIPRERNDFCDALAGAVYNKE